MKLKLLNFIKFLILFTLCMGLIQYLIVDYFFADTYFYYSTIANYSFLSLLTLLSYFVILCVNMYYKDYTGYMFMAAGVFKMIIAIVFLLPIILSDEKTYIPDVLAFFIPYFLFLFFETVFVVKLLQTNK